MRSRTFLKPQLKTKNSVSKLPVRPGGNITDGENCPLGKRVIRILWNRNQLARCQLNESREHPVSSRSIIAKGFLHIAPAVLHSTREDHSILPCLDRSHLAPRSYNTYDGRISDHHPVLATVLTDI